MPIQSILLAQKIEDILRAPSPIDVREHIKKALAKRGIEAPKALTLEDWQEMVTRGK